MNTIHIDDKHERLLERLLARLSSTGTKIDKKDVIDKLIEAAVGDDDVPTDEKALPDEGARHEQNKEERFFPIPIPDEEEVQKRFAGSYIATRDGKIVAVDPSLRGLHDKCKALGSGDGGCHIEYIEDGVMVYGFSL
ncbi:MAG: hypothetical protein JW839_11310 [Candidatus Lokiarchaeota archaeon]|nr:hypothetical protein [Candidatus Lokiarchaeota archaeon]